MNDFPTSTMVISMAEPEHNLAKLLPTDPFGMDSGTSLELVKDTLSNGLVHMVLPWEVEALFFFN